MKKVGITGGIGSGKSTIVSIFRTLGVECYNSDQRARWLINNLLVSQIIEIFGPASYLPTAELDSHYVAQRVFGDRSLLERLNSVVHPAVALDFERWCAERQDQPYILKEAAILIESGAVKSLDCVIVVTAPEELRIERVMRRDSSSRDQILARMAAQLSEVERLTYADYVITADDQHLITPQVIRIDQLLRK